MNHKLTSSLFFAAAVVGAIGTATISTGARADDITMDKTAFQSSKSRDEVRADLKTPWPGGYPWSSSYKMGIAKSDRSPSDVRQGYLTSRDEVRAINSEDSGSSYFTTRAGRSNPAATMGGPSR